MAVYMHRERTGRAPRIAGVVLAVAMAAAGGWAAYRYVFGAGFPSGTHDVQVYTVDGALTTPGAGRGGFLGMCDADTFHITVDSAELCVSVNGSLGTVPATGTDRGIVLAGPAVASLRSLTAGEDASMILLRHDGGWVAAVDSGALADGGPLTATPVD
ncbi:hypothetical protein [Catenuloplanes atrovinosus]|uniref:Uncharacterized protein n=1 Tax=Catenuloplanes atrovinosus TaxID=137266 RepID=A0AAE3YPU0_9ACTN|nr:hypothetical protein [Catenuloplanes atrovinosus]MDR7277808.1 hypothetical protein [Catenuloplanes atrovinosus]